MKINKPITVKNTGEKSKSFFFKLFVLISILVIVIIFLVSLVMNSIFTRHATDTIQTSNQKILSQISFNFRYMDAFVNQFIVNTFEDKKTKILLYSDVEDMSKLIEGVDYLDANRYNSPFVQSYYLYNAETEYFFCLGKANVRRNKDEMYDREVVDILESVKPYDALKPIARTIPISPFEIAYKTNVYTYVLCSFDPKSDDLTEAIIVNIDADWIINNIKAMTSKQLGQENIFMMVDRTGTVLGHTSDDMFLTNVSKEPYIKEILSSGYPTGIFKKAIDNHSFYITYSTLEESDVTFISISPENSLSENFLVIQKLLAVIVVVVLVIGLCASFIMSKVLYAPLRTLQGNLRLLFNVPPADTYGQKDEFKHMNNVFLKLKTDMKNLRDFRNNNLDSVKNQYLMHLIGASPIDAEGIQSHLKQCGAKLTFDRKMLLVLYTIDHCQEFLKNRSSNDANALCTAIANEIDRLLEQNFICETMVMRDDFLSFINIPEQVTGYDAMVDLIKPLLSSIQKAIEKQYALSLTLTISPIIHTIYNIAPVFKTTLLLSKYRLVLGHGSIITPEIENNMTSDSFHLPVKETKDFTDAIKKEELELSEKLCKKILYNLSQNAIQDIRFGLSYVSLSIIDTVNTIANNGNISFDMDFITFNNEINSMETLDEVREHYLHTLERIIQKIKESKDNKTHDIIEAVNGFIEKNLTDINLSSTMVAEYIGLTSKYLNVLFKKHTGSSIAATINAFRLEKAREMLLNKNNSIDSIIENIGWGSKKYFYTCFKKEFGVTPNVYRSTKE